ncbi:MAG TPA: hypothetical protein VL856_13750, partial [Acidimicrobiia bacterium]|nr:hypothetical protein [Acidimicrobiia bacterium]
MAEQSGVPVAIVPVRTDRFGIPVPSASGEVDIVRHGRHALHDASRHGDAQAMVDACLDLITVLEAQHRALAVTWALEDTIHRL